MKFARAPLGRRLISTAVDMLIPIAVAVASGLFVARLPYSPPGGWFWSEWLLKIWLDYPSQLLVPLAVFVGVWLCLTFAAEGVSSRSPGARAAGLEVVTARGRPIGWRHAMLRLLGGVINVLLLGFGSTWSLADPEGRTLQDRLSGTWVVVRESP